MIIGLTGGIGSGKTAVSDRFKALGIHIVDADIAARTIVEPNKPAWQEIKEFFGPDVLLADQTLNRAWLRQQVFADNDKRKKLEAITHPHIREEIIRNLAESNSPFTILVSPLLIESGQFKLVEKIIVVDVPESIQIERTSYRDQNSSDQIKRIISTQLSKHKRLSYADYVISNIQDFNSENATLDTQVLNIYNKLLSLTC